MDSHENIVGRTNGFLVLLPYCLEAVDGLVAKIKAQNTAVEVVRDSEHLLEVVQRRAPSFVVGLCCSQELDKLRPMLGAAPFRYYPVVLERHEASPGVCQTRVVDEEALLKALGEARRTENRLKTLEETLGPLAA